MISVGALIGLTTVMMILMLGQSRVFFAMSRDRLLPPVFAKVSPRFGTPVRTTIITGVAVALISTFVPLTELAELVNIGTLFAFVLVAIGVLVLRRTRPDLERAFRCPGVPLVPILAVLASVYLMLNLPGRDLAAVLRLDGHRPRRLLRLRRPAQPAGHRPELLARGRQQQPGEALRVTWPPPAAHATPDRLPPSGFDEVVVQAGVEG